MEIRSHLTPTSHQLSPFGMLGRQCSLIPTCHSSDYPISNLFTMSPELESEPIVLLDSHDAVEVGYCHSGAGIMAVEGRVIHFSAGDICAVGDGQPHMSRSAISTSSRWSYFWIDYGLLLGGMPDGLKHAGNNPFHDPDFPFVFSPAAHKALCLLVRDLVTELEAQEDGYRNVVKGLAMAFIARLCRLYPNPLPAAPAPGREGIERIAPSLNYVASHYTDVIDIRELADLCNLSLRHFERLFLTAVGRTPRRYLAQFRVTMAAAMLIESSKPISQIAYAVGFESINTFNRQFQAVMNMTPRQWRRAHSQS